MATEPIKREGRYVCGKLRTWKDCIKTNFHGQDVLYDMHCNARTVLKINSVNKQGKDYHPQVYVEECKHTDAEKQQCSMLSDDDDDDDDDGFEDKRRTKYFCNLPGFTKLTINE